MTTAEMTKEAWVEEYAKRIFKIWRTWQGPLGVCESYKEHLKEELNHKFDDSLKRSFIEMNYPDSAEDEKLS